MQGYLIGRPEPIACYLHMTGEGVPSARRRYG